MQVKLDIRVTRYSSDTLKAAVDIYCKAVTEDPNTDTRIFMILKLPKNARDEQDVRFSHVADPVDMLDWPDHVMNDYAYFRTDLIKLRVRSPYIAQEVINKLLDGAARLVKAVNFLNAYDNGDTPVPVEKYIYYGYIPNLRITEYALEHTELGTKFYAAITQEMVDNAVELGTMQKVNASTLSNYTDLEPFTRTLLIPRYGWLLVTLPLDSVYKVVKLGFPGSGVAGGVAFEDANPGANGVLTLTAKLYGEVNHNSDASYTTFVIKM